MSWYLDDNNLLINSIKDVYQGGRYIKADWIEFNWETHTGYIDVGYPRTNNRTLIVDFECVDSINAEEWICGAAVDVNTSHGNGAIVGTSSGTYWYTGLGAGYSPSNMQVGVRTRGTITNGYNNSSNNHIYIGCRNWAYAGETSRPNNNIPSDFKVYYFYLADGSTVLRDMYPAYDVVNQEWGMYDKVSQSFFGNAGGAGTSIKGGFYLDNQDRTPQPLAFDYSNPPASMWTINNDEIIVNGLLPDRLRWQRPYPYSMWFLDHEDNDIIINELLPDILTFTGGAFRDSVNLKYIKVPSTVTNIGPYSFANTGLTLVQLPTGCTYSETTFPPGCEIQFYDV